VHVIKQHIKIKIIIINNVLDQTRHIKLKCEQTQFTSVLTYMYLEIKFS